MTSNDTTDNNNNNDDDHQFQFTNMKQRQSLMESTVTENKRYSKKQQQQQEDNSYNNNEDEIPEALPSLHNDNNYYDDQHNNNSMQRKNKNKAFINPFDSLQSSNNFGLGHSNSTSTNNLLVQRSTKKLNFNTSTSSNNIFPAKANNKRTNYGTNNNYILEDDINFKINDNNNDDEQDNNESSGKYNNNMNYDVFTSESNFKLSQEITKHDTSNEIQINLANVNEYVIKYPVPHCVINTYDTNKKIECIVNNALYEELHCAEFKVMKYKPYYKWLTPSQDEIYEYIDKLFYDNVTSMKVFEEQNKLLHKTLIHVKESYTSYISDLYTYTFNHNLHDDTFTHYRKVVCDDDYSGLFRVLIFAYMENCICFNRKDVLSITLYNFLQNHPQLQENISHIITVKILLEHLNKNQLDLAYQVLLNTFIINTSFVNYIVNYIGQIYKHVFANYKANTNFFNELLYKMKKGNNMECISQSTVCLIYIFGILFNTSVHIYQPYINESKVYYCSSNNIKTHMMYLIFDYPVFYIGYPSMLGSLTSYSQKIMFSKVDNMVIMNDAITKCNDCNNKTMHVIIQEKTKPICKDCLVNAIQSVINVKTDLLCKDVYSFPMYYCSRIILHSNLILLNETSMQLNNNISIHDSIRINVASQKTCAYCSKQLTITKKCVALYQCGCLYCKECLLSQITADTNGKVLLNHYELITSKYKFKCNGCNNVVETMKEYVGIVSCVLDEEKLKKVQHDAWKRMAKELDVRCCICGSESKDNQVVINEKQHIICNKCKDSLDKRNVQGKKEFECLFCGGNKHEYNSLLMNIGKEYKEIQESEKMKKKHRNSDNKCCINF